MRAFSSVLLLVFTIASPLFCVAEEAWKDRARQILAEAHRPGGPGGALGVVINGELAFAEGFGSANLDYGIANTPDSIFDIASCSKQFTAALALLLSFDGVLDLDCDIRTILPELALATPISPRQLMIHTSGLQDYSELQVLARGRDELHTQTVEDIRDLVKAQTSIAFQPGERSLYSNTNYLILAWILEKASGKSLGKLAKERIFEPLGMQSTFFVGDTRAVVPYRATGYARVGDRFLAGLNPHPKEVVGPGGLHSSVRDLAKWMGHLMRPNAAVGGERLIEELTRPGTLADGSELDLGSGVMLGELEGQRWVEHAGHSEVYNSLLTWWRDADIAVIVLTNDVDISPWSISNPLIRPLLGDRLAGKQTEPTTASVSLPRASNELDLTSEELALFAGTYPADAPVGDNRPPHGGVGVLTITLEEHGLRLRLPDGLEAELRPVSRDTLEAIDVGIPIKLKFNGLGERGQNFRFDNPTGHLRDVELRLLSVPPETILESYVGDYRASDLGDGSPIRITRQGPKLFMHWGRRQIRQEVFVIEPNRLTTYSPKMQCNLIFTRNSEGQIDGFTYEGHRVWNLRFDRQ